MDKTEASTPLNCTQYTDRRCQIGAFIAGARAAVEAARAQFDERTGADLALLERLRAYVDGAEPPDVAVRLAAVESGAEPCGTHEPAASPGLCWACDAHREHLRITIDEIPAYTTMVDYIFIEAAQDGAAGPLDLPVLLSDFSDYASEGALDTVVLQHAAEGAAAAYLAQHAPPLPTNVVSLAAYRARREQHEGDHA